MKSIWKYEIKEIKVEIIIPMPAGSEVLSIQVQNNVPCLWVLVDPQKKMHEKKFLIFETGHYIQDIDINSTLKFIGTFQMHNGNFVGHLFEVI